MENLAQKKILDRVQSVSASILESQSLLSPVQTLPLAAQDLPFHQFIAMTMLVSREVRIFFRTHTSMENIVGLARKKYRIDSDSFGEQQGVDFIKEFCNVVSGRVVESMKIVGVDLGIGLPFATQGFNQIFFDDAVDASAISCWRLQVEDYWVSCSLRLEILDKNLLGKIEEANFQVEELDSMELF